MSRDELVYLQDIARAYFGIDDDVLWDVVQNKVPQLAKVVTAFLDKNRG